MFENVYNLLECYISFRSQIDRLIKIINQLTMTVPKLYKNNFI